MSGKKHSTEMAEILTTLQILNRTIADTKKSEMSREAKMRIVEKKFNELVDIESDNERKEVLRKTMYRYIKNA